MSKKWTYLYCTVVLLFFNNEGIIAQTITATTPITFGSIIYTNSPGTISIDENGIVSASGVYVKSPPVRGTVTIKAPNGSGIYITSITVGNATLSYGGNSIAFTGMPITTDKTASYITKKLTKTFYIGGTLTLPGSLPSGTYATTQGAILIQFTFTYN